MVFVNENYRSEAVAKYLNAQGISATSLSSGQTSESRAKIISEFRRDKYPVLVTTDEAVCELDIKDLEHVCFYNIANVL